jgi:hypothetical protein
MSLPPKVLPGDLITADFMNQIIDLITLHDQEIQTLLSVSPGGTGPVAITTTVPAGVARVGDPFRVIGRGFGLPTQVSVTLETTPATLEPGSNDTQLLFHVPVVRGLPDNGRTVVLTVAAAAGTAATSIVLLPPPAKTDGDMGFAIVPPSVSLIQAGLTYDFTCTIRGTTTQDDRYTLSAAAGTSTGSWAVTVTDENGNALSSIPIPRSANTFTQVVHLHVTVPNGATGQGFVSLTVTCQGNPDFARTSGQSQFQVGAAPPPPSTIDVLPTVVDGYDTVTPDSKGVLNLTIGHEIDFVFGATLDAGQYDLSFDAQDGANLWNPKLLQASPLVTSGPSAQVSASVTPATGAPDTQVAFVITNRNDRTKFGQVAFKVHMNDPKKTP